MAIISLEQSLSQRNAFGAREQHEFVSCLLGREVHYKSDSTQELFMGDHYEGIDVFLFN